MFKSTILLIAVFYTSNIFSSLRTQGQDLTLAVTLRSGWGVKALCENEAVDRHDIEQQSISGGRILNCSSLLELRTIFDENVPMGVNFQVINLCKDSQFYRVTLGSADNMHSPLKALELPVNVECRIPIEAESWLNQVDLLLEPLL